MPTYEYECPEGHEFEIFQKMSDEPRAECPECGREAKRVLSGGGGLLFKGKGFYATDYRSAEYRKKAEKEKKSGPSGDSGSSAGAKDAASGGDGGGTSAGDE